MIEDKYPKIRELAEYWTVFSPCRINPVSLFDRFKEDDIHELGREMLLLLDELNTKESE